MSNPFSSSSRAQPAVPATQPTTPHLTPQFCFNTRTLRDFLRQSRSQLDDTISTNLNSLLTPSSTQPFNPQSTSPSSSPSTTRGPRPPIPAQTCSEFISTTLLPTWHTRTAILNYCSNVASSPDPNDPDLIQINAANAAAQQREINERLDPYSGRFFPREPRTEVLGAVLRNENVVEGIVRERTWRIICERCATGTGTGTATGGDGDVRSERWEEEVDRWRARQDHNGKEG